MWAWLKNLFGGGKNTKKSAEKSLVQQIAERDAIPDEKSEFEVIAPPWNGGIVIEELADGRIRKDMLDDLNNALKRFKSAPDRQFFERLIKEVSARKLDLPPFPDVAAQLTKMLDDRNVTMVKVATLVERDAGLVRRVWTDASSVVYQSKPTSLHHACARVGLDTIWRIAMYLAVSADVFNPEGFEEQSDRVRIRGVAVAELMSELSKEPRGNMYIAGLLHEVGKLLVMRIAGQTYGGHRPDPALVDRVAQRYNAPLGALVGRAWKLNELAALGIGFQYNAENAPAQAAKCAGLLRISNIAVWTAESELDGKNPHGLEALQKEVIQGFDPKKVLESGARIYEALLDERQAREDQEAAEAEAEANEKAV